MGGVINCEPSDPPEFLSFFILMGKIGGVGATNWDQKYLINLQTLSSSTTSFASLRFYSICGVVFLQNQTPRYKQILFLFSFLFNTLTYSSPKCSCFVMFPFIPNNICYLVFKIYTIHQRSLKLNFGIL